MEKVMTLTLRLMTYFWRKRNRFFDGPSNKFFQSSSSFRNVEKQFVECQIYLPNAEPCNKRHSDHGADDLNNF